MSALAVLRRAHIDRSHSDWAEEAKELSDELMERYHRADHERAGANARHVHEEYES